LERRDREKLLKKMERSIAEEFRRRLSKGQAPGADVDVRELLGRQPPPALRLERQAPPRPEKETFSQMLARYMEEEPVREETFTQKLERHLQELPDFRTKGERRRDERREAARRKPPKREPSAVDKLLALLEAEGKKGRRAEAPSSKSKKGKARHAGKSMAGPSIILT
jgi:hypothetical protein